MVVLVARHTEVSSSRQVSPCNQLLFFISSCAVDPIVVTVLFVPSTSPGTKGRTPSTGLRVHRE